MAIEYITAPNARWQATTLVGEFAAGGFVETFDAGDKVTPKAVYGDPGGTQPLPNPFRLDGDGGATVFWKIETGQPLYFIRIYDKDLKLLGTFDNYPTTGSAAGGSIVTNEIDIDNYILNPQFFYWLNGTSFTNSDLPIGSTKVSDSWEFERTSTIADVQIQRLAFPLGSVNPPDNPTYMLRYITDGAAPDGANRIRQEVRSVQSFSGREISVTFWARTGAPATTSTITLQYQQFFGTGGTPSVTNTVNVQTFNIDENYTQYSATFVVDSVAGESLGTNGDDYFAWMFQYQISQAITVDMVNILVKDNTAGNPFPVLTNEQYLAELLPFELKEVQDGQGSDFVQYSETETVRDRLDFLLNRINIDPQVNLLIGWDFTKNPRQLGLTNTTTTFAPNNNNTYVMDETILLSDGNNIVNISTPSVPYFDATVVTANRKFGIFQILTGIDTVNLRNLKLSMRMRTFMTGLSGIKMAILKWEGAFNSPARDPISSWNGTGILPTLNAGWSFLVDGNGAQFSEQTINGSFAETVFENVQAISTVPSPLDNLGVLIWSDDANASVGANLQIDKVQLAPGENASGFYVRTQQEEYELCQHYIYSTYAKGTAPASITPLLEAASFNLGADLIADVGTRGPIAYDYTIQDNRVTHTLPREMFFDAPSKTLDVYSYSSGLANTIDIDGTAALSTYPGVPNPAVPSQTYPANPLQFFQHFGEFIIPRDQAIFKFGAPPGTSFAGYRLQLRAYYHMLIRCHWS